MKPDIVTENKSKMIKDQRKVGNQGCILLFGVFHQYKIYRFLSTSDKMKRVTMFFILLLIQKSFAKFPFNFIIKICFHQCC